ncbi:hypothetical protein LEMLEM_LOCUS8824, partial [Lemmus lemmus]
EEARLVGDSLRPHPAPGTQGATGQTPGRAELAGSGQRTGAFFLTRRVFSSPTWIYLSALKSPSLPTDRSVYLFAYKPVTINDYSDGVIRTLMTSG